MRQGCLAVLMLTTILSACLRPGESTSPAGQAAGGEAAGGSSTASQRLFSVDSPFNLPINEAPVLDPNSAAMVAYLARKSVAYAGLYEFGIPLWTSSPTSEVAVSCTMSQAWGACPFVTPVPIPEEAYPNTGSDGAMVVLDFSTNQSFEFWQFRRDGARAITSWGAIHDLTGTGWGGVGSSTASGASRAGGVVRLEELGQGRVEHALVMSIDNSCSTGFRPPAIKTDGNSQRADCVPQGSRLQLDPSVDVSQIEGITEGEKIIATALQRYGVYVIDKGGAPMAISFELAHDATGLNNPGAVYTSLGFAWDYFDMPHIPWTRLRVLARWDGS